MAFDDVERSAQLGRPVFFVKFTRASKEWRYTNVDQDITFNSQVYAAIPLIVPSFLQSGDAKASDMTLELPSSASICTYLDSRTPTSVINVSIRRGHMVEDEFTGTFTAPILADAPIVWVGEIIGIERPAVNKRGLLCNTLSLSMNRGGLRLTWSRNCPHMLYERGCFVNKASFVTNLAGITVVDGVTISATEVDALADGWFNGGFLEWDSETGVTERLGIETHVGPLLTVFGSTYGVAGGAAYKVYPGCDRRASTCNSKFSNILNFGGINHMQGRSPFDGNPVF